MRKIRDASHKSPYPKARVSIWATLAPKYANPFDFRIKLIIIDHCEIGFLCLDMKLRKKWGKKLHDNGYAEDE